MNRSPLTRWRLIESAPKDRTILLAYPLPTHRSPIGGSVVQAGRWVDVPSYTYARQLIGTGRPLPHDPFEPHWEVSHIAVGAMGGAMVGNRVLFDPVGHRVEPTHWMALPKGPRAGGRG